MQDWQDIAFAKKQGELNKIHPEWRLPVSLIEAARERKVIAGAFIESLLDKTTLSITRLDPIDIVARTSNGSLSASSVVSAFCKRAAYGHQIALRRRCSEHGAPVGPLHGLPVTLKDQFHVQGMETCFAYVGWVGTFEGVKGTGKEGVVQSEIVDELVGLGAVVIGKTSLATTTWAPETNNNIVGYQFNPWNQRLSAGGSSGGEGSVQGLRGSAMGIGSDSGGSVGMPAACNGVYSHKPSSGRLSFKDAPASGKANLVIPGVVGFLGPSVASLKLMFQSIQSTEPWKRDPFVLPLGYREELEYKPDRDPLPAFGIMKHDGTVRPHPPIARAMDIVEIAVQKAGFQTLAWNPPPHAEAALLHGPIARGDGTPDAWENIQLSGEPIIPQLLRKVFPGGKLRPPMNLVDWEKKVLELQDYRTRYQAYWESTADSTADGRPVEALLVPISSTAAVIPGKFTYAKYSSFVNVLDYCSVVIQVGFADKNIDVAPGEYEPLSEQDKENMATYDAEIYDGTPTAIQMVGRRYDEERLLSLAQVVVNALETCKSG